MLPTGMRLHYVTLTVRVPLKINGPDETRFLTDVAFVHVIALFGSFAWQVSPSIVEFVIVIARAS